MGGVEPTTGDGLQPGVEPDSLGAVCLDVAEQGVLPPTEAEGRDGDGDGHVDADHADLDVLLEPSRSAAVIGEDRRAVAESGRVDQLYSGVVRRYAHDREDGAEDFLGINPGSRGDLVDESRAQPEPARVAVSVHLAPIDHDGCAISGRNIDVGGNLVAVLPGDEGTHVAVAAAILRGAAPRPPP